MFRILPLKINFSAFIMKQKNLSKLKGFFVFNVVEFILKQELLCL